jgi:hypothetical protein
MDNKGEVIIYQTSDGLSKLEVNLKDETVWLSIDQMAELFQRDKSTISRHIKKVFEEGELIRDSVVAYFATTASDGKTYNVEYFNLDVIISVGYRVKSQRTFVFEYVIKAYAFVSSVVSDVIGNKFSIACTSEIEYHRQHLR